MSLGNSRKAYGWAAIFLHWVSAAGVAVLYLLGERMEAVRGPAEKAAALDLHVSVGVLLFTFLAARLLWSVSQPAPTPLDRNPIFRLLAKVVQVLFLTMILALLVTGPLAIWSAGRPIPLFDLLVLPSPIGRSPALHEFAEALRAISPAAHRPAGCSG